MERDTVIVRQLGLILCLVLAFTLPFAGKAIHIDDVYFVEIAENVLADPLRPLAGAVTLEDADFRAFAARHECPNTFESMSHPPLVPYAIAALAAASGGIREPALHVGFAGFALLAAGAMYSLSRRFTTRPLEAALLLVSAPIFLLSASSLMTDMPALAFSLAGLAAFVRGVDSRRRAWLWAGGLLLGFAALTRYSVLAMLPLLVLYAFGQGRVRACLPALAAAGLVLAPWAAQNLAFHGTLHVLASARHYRAFYAGQSFDLPALARKAFFDLSALGGTLFAAAFLLLPSRPRQRVPAFGLAGLAAAAVFVLRPRGSERLASYSGPEAVAVCLCVAAGALLVVEAFRSAREDTGGGQTPEDARFLAFWLALALVGAIVVLPFGAARYALTVLPPLGLLLVRAWQRLPRERRLVRLAPALIVLQGLGLGSVMGVADAEAADGYRSVARQLRREHAERRIWFVGEWGFRHYMEAAGGRYLRSDDESPGTGDLIVRPVIAGMHEMSPSLRARAARIQEIATRSRWPIRLMSFDARAGYYSHHWGYLPWALSQAPLETFEVFEVRGPAPEAPGDPCASS